MKHRMTGFLLPVLLSVCMVAASCAGDRDLQDGTEPPPAEETAETTAPVSAAKPEESGTGGAVTVPQPEETTQTPVQSTEEPEPDSRYFAEENDSRFGGWIPLEPVG